MTKELLIIFVKNIKAGKVKTRLAKTIGEDSALKIYQELVNITEKISKKIASDVRVYFSEAPMENQWKSFYKTTQKGVDLGERMKNAFQDGFNDGYQRIVLIGSDLPEIAEEHINNGLNVLKKNDVVFGPALDGGYYLIGLSKMHHRIFENKPWSQPNLLEDTLNELKQNKITVATLNTLNDIDTFEDLKKFPKLLQLLS
ncbi:TIGR04282 family arsenosugar biosynthesis glycosyltransferase [Algibacter mikhailovii]|uniref:TIGR04282 family arsenosugar biosynthesis glycosyltransferase n=1 Tax=Algibacter mikhailovii TaxID=425498 RepID=UPI00249442C2|nr:TIGR04282 family arsenosugar biosynthesis glycosyltransferase [Algibacter mikhailovii]